jgi:TfoX/Sxy family transcriptional regulator of competence genes
MAYPSAQPERVREVLGKRPGLVEKEMFGGIAFLLGGKMCVGVHGEDLIVRVEPEKTAALLRELGAKPFDLSGSRTPSGWLMVTPAGYRTDAALRAWVARGVAFALSLPAKGAKKTKPSRARAASH